MSIGAIPRRGDDGEEVHVEDLPFVTGTGGMYYPSNAADPNLTVRDEDDVDSLEDQGLEESDAMVVVARTTEELSKIEFYVYQEDMGHAYIHHDIILDSYPICMAWRGCDPTTQGPVSAAAPASLLAVGTFNPGIELFDANVIDIIQPNLVLGGPEGGEGELVSGSHTSAVLGLDWNPELAHVLASGSADGTVKLWDVSTASAVTTLTHHMDKVAGVAWNPSAPNVLLTAGYDRVLALVDAREGSAAPFASVPGDPEVMVWDPFDTHRVFVACDNGSVYAFDARAPDAGPLFVVDASTKPLCSMVMSQAIPGLLATGSISKAVTFWDVGSESPSQVFTSSKLHIGQPYALSFFPDSPFIMATGGGNGTLNVVDLFSAKPFRSRFGQVARDLGIPTPICPAGSLGGSSAPKANSTAEPNWGSDSDSEDSHPDDNLDLSDSDEDRHLRTRPDDAHRAAEMANFETLAKDQKQVQAALAQVAKSKGGKKGGKKKGGKKGKGGKKRR